MYIYVCILIYIYIYTHTYEYTSCWIASHWLLCNLEGMIDFHYGWLFSEVAKMLKGKILMFPNRIWGSQAETRRWTLEIKSKGFQCRVSPPKQETKTAP